MIKYTAVVFHFDKLVRGKKEKKTINENLFPGVVFILIRVKINTESSSNKWKKIHQTILID